MILSVSRRTDIPGYYPDWFFNRIKEGWLYVRNPMNPRQVSKIILSPDVVDCIVFWTKNPEPMLTRLEELKGYSYYFQFTLTPYGKDIEPYVPHKKELETLQLKEKSEQEIREFVKFLSYTAKQYGIQVTACAEGQDFSDCGVGRSSCIDKELIERIAGSKLKVSKDSGQRPECGCVESIEVGTYDTCLNGCRYCYANVSRKRAEENYRLYDSKAPILCGSLNLEDKITERKVKSLKEDQLTIWNL